MHQKGDVTINGNAGVGLAENIMSGRVHVKGDASQSAAATGHGGLVVIDGNAGARERLPDRCSPGCWPSASITRRASPWRKSSSKRAAAGRSRRAPGLMACFGKYGKASLPAASVDVVAMTMSASAIASSMVSAEATLVSWGYLAVAQSTNACVLPVPSPDPQPAWGQPSPAPMRTTTDAPDTLLTTSKGSPWIREMSPGCWSARLWSA